ncbi:MAG: CpsD/CapB family tyrosine-protein kinase [Clostridia bacterium]|nr:CpsD/CapB family tyrosine-protein kinase [Clostridia bacterium]MBQ7289251.1 CpsD/CapB family tyrosine-protein kinase [Clostridia bacterium]
MRKQNKKAYVSSVSAAAPEKKSTYHLPFAVVEAYKTVRTNLQFVLAGHSKKQIVVSSPLMEEGKSTTAINMAIAFSQLGCKVLIVDADLRKPSVHKKLRVQNTDGLSSVLVDLCPFSDAVETINANLDVLTSGPLPPNPSELLSSERMKTLLRDLEQKYDYVFIDTPPVNIVSDALVLAPKTNGIILVVRDRSTTHEEMKKALNYIEFAKTHYLGTILNGATDSQNGNYRRKYSKKYHYRYAYK